MTRSRLARAKINLTLHITGRREDGYHLLESIVAFADFGDRVSAAQADTLSLNVSGRYAAVLGSDNLVLKAARALQDFSGTTRGAAFHLEKRLPVASGLGGGSADAAAALWLLNDLWELGFSEAALAEIGLGLGADVPMCLHSKTAIARGIGEKLTPIALPRWYVLLVNPGVVVATEAMFREFAQAPSYSQKLEYSLENTINCIDILKRSRNDLEPVATHAFPVIGEVLMALNNTPGCLLSRMSGSGATCFALYEHREQTQMAQERLQKEFPEAWIECSFII